ncbi:MAG: response regulator [bacterium]
MKNVMIVDDEIQFAEHVARTLQEMDEQLSVIAVKSGEEALKELENRHIDIVITDVKLPVMDGVKLAEIIKSKWPNVSIIMMTAYGTDETVKLAFHTGALFYIEKPFKIESLNNMIRIAGLRAKR